MVRIAVHRRMTQYFITILCDIVDHKIYSVCVPNAVKSISTISHISNLILVVHTPHHLYIIHLYITSSEDVSNRIHKYKYYILHDIILEIRRQLLKSEKPLFVRCVVNGFKV